ncbi:IS4 family transposase [uncultured Lactobacillus sp.]|uniref:IS4 family transposase n=1 Tax=uncultured Lactobacillus sp. TaxID=153152 RepID=UPI002608D18B|nr:IS4 family transposase [uncultured Lactobacillus sp.]
MKSLHSNILKLIDQIINQIAANIHSYTNSTKAFSRCRKLNVADLIKLILNMGAGSLNTELFKAFPDINTRMTASAFEQQKAKLKPECFREIMIKLNQAKVNLTLLDKHYQVVAIDGSDFNQPFNPKSENIFKGKDGCIYCQIHVNALYDILNKLYLDIVFQPRIKMDEREAALKMLKELNKQGQDFLVLMDRGYGSFNLIENCNRLNHCQYIIRAKAKKASGGVIKEIAAMPNQECDIDLSCRVTSSNYYYITHKDSEQFLHLIMHKKRHYKAVRSKNTADQRWDFADFCNVKFRVCKFKINSSGSADEWEVLITNLNRNQFLLQRMKEIYHLRWGIENSFRELKYDLSGVQFHSKKDQFVYLELYAHFAMYNAVSLSLSTCSKPNTKRKYSYQLDFKMACYIWRQYFNSNDFSDKNFIQFLLNMASYLTPIRPGRKDKRYLKDKIVVCFPYRLAA